MDWLNETYQILIAIGLLLAAVDILVLGFSTFFLTIIGLALVVTGLVLALGVIPDSELAITLSVAILSAIFTLALYKPLKALQSKKPAKPNSVSSDLIGMTVILEQELSPESPSIFHFSGVDWKLKSSEHLSAGTEVFVVQVNVGEMVVASQPLGDED